ncbi:MAG: hypothetical protein J6Z29_11930 [Ruminococcus sp.]|jgi:hypothetical protein|uniref:DUF2262 domain-containing protein n=1 Tax=uncultured Ruminococcus sp. TaxID=165186 RepID=UPI001B4A911B|nr:DUF2262 domain-containing protein [uncultured Ruminococcus sp.]MBE6868279.1 hypothetical protein [Ruminococcus albus]MBP5269252.1 hypothetical protein [Ruminococcus sp.]
MSFFGKLFGKKEKPVEQPVLKEGQVATPLGIFTFVDDEYIYEGLVKWYDDDEYQIDAYIETVAEGSDDMGDGVERFIQLLNNKEEMDYRVKMAALEHFADESGLIMSESQHMLMSKELFLENLKIEDIGIHRDGSVCFTIFDTDIQDIRSIYITYTDKGTFEFETNKYDWE